MNQLTEIVAKLRAPDGCPWDRKQDHLSLVPYLLEEAWEVIDEIKKERISDTLKEELGDLLLQVVLHAQIASEENRFDIEDVIASISQKMIRRHPHVFETGAKKVSEEEQNRLWHQQKTSEKERKSVLDGIPTTIPALMRALKLGERAASLGFDWKNPEDVLEKVYEELQEVSQEISRNDPKKLEEEIGDLLFTITNLARLYKINPEIALKRGNDKFKTRFQTVEPHIQKAEKEGRQLTFEEMDAHWNQSKISEHP